MLFTGKGGVGKTTLAAATGARLAADGMSVLVVSTDPAHSLGDAFDRSVGADPVSVDDRLHASHIDARALVDDAWAELREHLRHILAGAGVGELDAEELTVLPGVEELLALSEVRRLADSGRWDAVVVDCGPTAETLRLLALPEAIEGYLDRLFPANRRMMRGLFTGITGARSETLDATGEALRTLVDRLDGLRGMLTDTTSTSVRLVLTPERVVVAETRRTLTALALQGITVDGLVANRLVPRSRLGAGVAARWMRTRRAEQEAVLADVRAATDEPVRTVEHTAGEPVGAAALLRLARDLYGARDPLAADAHGGGPLLSVTGGGRGANAEYQLRIGVPLGHDAEPQLARVGDDLAVTVDGRRRLVALPSVLRRCAVTGAECDSGGVLVRFRPEPGRRGDDAGGASGDRADLRRDSGEVRS